MSGSIKNRSRKKLLMALTLGLVAAVATFAYVSSSANQAPKQKMVSVVVAKTNVPANTKLDPSMLAAKSIPLDAKTPAALTSVADAEGKLTAFPLSAGEQVLTTGLLAGQPDQISLAQMVPEGKRAMAVNFSETIGSGGLIVPGDNVDVVAVLNAQTSGKDQAELILQDIPVLAIAQAIENDGQMPVAGGPNGNPTTVTAPNANAANPAVQGQAAQMAPARPYAKSATLAVTPEEAQRLALAEAMGTIRLILRPAKDTSTVDLPEATLSTLRQPLQTAAAMITAAQISPTTVKPGDDLVVKVTIKNTSNQPLQMQGPDPNFSYVQGQTYYSQNFPSDPGKYRVAVNFDGAAAPFPFRWGIKGGVLAPGASTTIEGHVKITYDFKPTNFWVGLIQEPANVVQDAVALTVVTSLPANTATVSVDAANVRSGPSISSGILTQLPYGKELPILGQQADWYKIQLDDGRQGWVAAGWIVTASGR